MKTRMWCEAVLAAMSAVLTVVTAVWPDWIELLGGASPDGGDGSFERLLALAMLVGTVVFVVLARRDFRRLASPLPPPPHTDAKSGPSSSGGTTPADAARRANSRRPST
jgi:hypothetical protein